MRMKISKGKGPLRAFLRVKADRNSLDDTDVVHGGLLIKVSQIDLVQPLVHADRGDGGRNLLDERKMLLPVALHREIDQLLKLRAPQPS